MFGSSKKSPKGKKTSSSNLKSRSKDDELEEGMLAIAAQADEAEDDFAAGSGDQRDIKFKKAKKGLSGKQSVKAKGQYYLKLARGEESRFLVSSIKISCLLLNSCQFFKKKKKHARGRKDTVYS